MLDRKDQILFDLMLSREKNGLTKSASDEASESNFFLDKRPANRA